MMIILFRESFLIFFFKLDHLDHELKLDRLLDNVLQLWE